MKVSPASDIVGIASSFGISAHQYKEIKRDEDAYEIAQRWPMLAELHGFAPQVTVEDASAGSAPVQEKSGLKVVGAAGQKAEDPYQPPAEQAQIAA